jgi:hypothetical protein
MVFGVGGKPLRLNYAGGEVSVGSSAVNTSLVVNGNLCIGANAPSYKLDVIGSTLNDAIIRVGTSANTDGRIIFGNINHGIGRGNLPGTITGNDVSVFTGGEGGFNVIINGGLMMCVKNGGNVGIGTNTPASKLHVNGAATATSFTSSSDDRIKSDEVFIENATETLKKLRPQTYNKWTTLEYQFDSNATSVKESGLIAQEMFYDAPELRHLITLPEGADSNALYSTTIQSSQDPSIDPDYKDWGSNIASVNYIGLIPYLVKAIQEKDEENKSLKMALSNILQRLDNANI